MGVTLAETFPNWYMKHDMIIEDEMFNVSLLDTYYKNINKLFIRLKFITGEIKSFHFYNLTYLNKTWNDLLIVIGSYERSLWLN